jgi:xanthine dehydrogenase YagS FAD-binding subunit
VRPFAYERGATLVKGLGRREGRVLALAGGTDLVPLLQQGLVQVDGVVDVAAAQDLPRGSERQADGGVRLGAGTTLAELAGDPALREGYAALAEAATVAASPQIRNVATLGGNLCQWIRCWYFRGGFPCLVGAGDGCPAVDGDHRHHAIFRDGPCIAVHPSDPAVALLALGARVETAGPGGARVLGLAELLRPPGPGRPETTTLLPGELVTAVLLPSPRGRSAYRKAMDRARWSFALASVAAVLGVEEGRVAHAAIALGGVAGVPRSAATAAASLVGRIPDAAACAEAAELATQGAEPLPGNAYKVELLRRLVRTVLAELSGAAAG